MKLLFSDAIPVLAWLNVLFSTLTVVLSFEIAREIHANALVAGLIVALYPNQLNYCRQLLSDTPTTFLLLSGIWFILTGKHFWAGLALYLAAMFRSPLLPILPAYLVIVWYFQRQLRSLRIYVLGASVGLVFHAVLLLADVILPAANFGLNLLIAVGSYSCDLKHSIGIYRSKEQAHPLQTHLSFAVHHPLTFIVQRLNSLWELWGPWPTHARSLLAKPVIGLRFPLLLMGGIGAYKYRRVFHAWILFTPVIVITLVHIAFFSYPRYTVPLEPLLIVLAAATLCDFENPVSLVRVAGRRCADCAL